MKQTLTLLATLLLFPLTALAHRCRDLIRDGAIINQSELAHYGQISTTRMTQIMWLDNLAPDIQEEILGLPRTVQGRDAILEKHVRPIAKTHDWTEQRMRWTELKQQLAGPGIDWVGADRTGRAKHEE